jgi:hypothetical protein
MAKMKYCSFFFCVLIIQSEALAFPKSSDQNVEDFKSAAVSLKQPVPLKRYGIIMAAEGNNTSNGVYVTPECAATVLLGTEVFAGMMAFWILPQLLALLGFGGKTLNLDLPHLFIHSIILVHSRRKGF